MSSKTSITLHKNLKPYKIGWPIQVILHCGNITPPRGESIMTVGFLFSGGVIFDKKLWGRKR